MPVCFVCRENIQRKRIHFYDGRPLHEKCLDQAILLLNKSIPLTSTHSLEGRRITDYIDVISGEMVIGSDLFSELGAGLADFSGGESGAFTGKLGEAKKLALQRLRGAAMALKANAVVGVAIDFTTLGGDKIAVVASGTAVRVRAE